MRILILIGALMLAMHAHADSAAKQAGRAVSEFGAGVGEVIGDGMMRGAMSAQPHWITIPARSKAECLAESGGVVNPTFVRCRNGWQERVVFDRAGNKHVLSERPIPMQ